MPGKILYEVLAAQRKNNTLEGAIKAAMDKVANNYSSKVNSDDAKKAWKKGVAKYLSFYLPELKNMMDQGGFSKITSSSERLNTVIEYTKEIARKYEEEKNRQRLEKFSSIGRQLANIDESTSSRGSSEAHYITGGMATSSRRKVYEI